MKTQQEKKQAPRLLTLEQARTLIVTGKGHAFEVPLMLMLGLGLRVGELLALQWQTINWQDGSLFVHRTWRCSQGSLAQLSFSPAKHPRTILLPQGMITCLQEHAACQEQERALADDRWQPLDLVICTMCGTPLSRERLRPLMQELLRQAHLPALRFHDLRLTTTHLLLQAGLAPPIIQELLGIGGHTLHSCQHWTPLSRADAEHAQQIMDQLFFTM